MIKSIFIQLWNRKRSNAFLLVELLLIFCLLWYIVDYFFVLGFNYSIPNYRDVDHTYQVNIRQFPSDHPEYRAEEDKPDVMLANYSRILNTIRNHPDVESIGVSFYNVAPGSDSFRNISFMAPLDTSKRFSPQVFTIDPAEDFLKVFRHTIDNGKKVVSTQDLDWTVQRPIIITKMMEDHFFDGPAPGAKIIGGENVDFTVIGVIDNLKRFDAHRPHYLFFRPESVSKDNINRAEISIRINPSADTRSFITKFKNDITAAVRIGNFHLTSVVSYKKRTQNLDIVYGLTSEIRTRAGMMLFFLINIILCLIGTFWYRVRERREEIGLRMAIGSSRKGIRNLFLAEGLCLLSLIIIPAMILEYQFVHAGLLDTFGRDPSNLMGYLPDRTMVRFLITNALTTLILAIAILSAVCLPAHRAASMPPADALHYE